MNQIMTVCRLIGLHVLIISIYILKIMLSIKMFKLDGINENILMVMQT